jgi:DnaJ-domain-containing protein 1
VSSESRRDWQHYLQAVLEAHPQGLSEFELLTRLDTDPDVAFEKGDLADSLNLFQTHFLLFNALYRLREQLVAAGEASVEISALRIRLLPLSADTDGGLAAVDPLRDYYLDLANLDETGRADVDELLGRFWQRYLVHERRGEYLAVLQLDEGADSQAIRRQYRRLAMQHHPDRGGDDDTLKLINEAYAALMGRS